MPLIALAAGGWESRRAEGSISSSGARDRGRRIVRTMCGRVAGSTAWLITSASSELFEWRASQTLVVPSGDVDSCACVRAGRWG